VCSPAHGWQSQWWFNLAWHKRKAMDFGSPGGLGTGEVASVVASTGCQASRSKHAGEVYWCSGPGGKNPGWEQVCVALPGGVPRGHK